MKTLSTILTAIFLSSLIVFLLPQPDLLKGISFSKAVYSKEHQLLRLTLSSDEKFRLFTPLTAISKQFIEGSLLQEDRYFYQHYGVNPYAMLKAFWQTYVHHSRRIGASTISMQLARMRYRINSKTILGKCFQIIKALQLEMHYSKNEILQAYFNLAPYGGNIEGVGAASLIYYNKDAAKLSLSQALTLSVIAQNPQKRTAKNYPLQAIRDRLFARWLIEHPKDHNKKLFFSIDPILNDIHTLPFSVPHFVNAVLASPIKHSQSIETSLNFRMQRLIERITHRYIARKKSLALNNAAVLLVDSREMAVKALVGSADFFNRSIHGQINGVEIKRSPGSTLKPFIYGLALDQGLIHPHTVLKDVAQSFNGYNPENFDYDFMGPIKAKDALVLSRNVPAIFLANQLRPNLYHLLEKAQISGLKAESYYGLSLNLGAVELSLRELVSLYAMLINDGLWYPVNFLKDGLKQHGVRLLSPEASFLILDMLQNNSACPIANRLPIAWKTGTSTGFRDAWTIGCFGPYILGVWVGNFDNKANPAFVGKDIAAPLFFEIIEAMEHEFKSITPIIKDTNHLNLKKIKICKASGLLPTKFCQDTEWTWFIPGKSPIKRDTIHREVAINPKTGLRTCHIDANTRFEIFEFWPSDLLSIFKKAGIQRHTPPFFEADCVLTTNNGLSPQITSPQNGLSYIVRISSKHTNKIPLTAVTDAGIKYLYWFINDTFIAKTRPNVAYLWPAKPGKFVLRVVDDHGLSDAHLIHIEMDT